MQSCKPTKILWSHKRVDKKPQDLTSTHEHLKTPQPHFISITENWKKKIKLHILVCRHPFLTDNKKSTMYHGFCVRNNQISPLIHYTIIPVKYRGVIRVKTPFHYRHKESFIMILPPPTHFDKIHFAQWLAQNYWWTPLISL